MRKNLIATVPKELMREFRKSLFTQNVNRIIFQSTIVVLVNIGLVLTFIVNSTINTLDTTYLIALSLECAIMLGVIVAFYQVSSRGYTSGGIIANNIAMFYVIVYLICELEIFILSSQGIGSLLRLVAISFVACNVTILSQRKTIAILALFYLTLYLMLPHLEYSVFLYPYISAYNFWLVCACCILISCSIYAWFVNQFLAHKTIEEKNDELEIRNEKQKQDIARRTYLLEVLNNITEILLKAETNNFEMALFDSMKEVAGAVDVEHICLWKNEIVDGKIYCQKLHEWKTGTNALVDNTNAEANLLISDWQEAFKENNCVNVDMDEISEAMKEPVRARISSDVVSAVVVPVTLYGEFWGFVGYADCKKKRQFAEVEETILKTISLLYAISVINNQMNIDLKESVNDALLHSQAKSAFLANMSHEIRTPINAIIGMLAILKKSKEVDLMDSLGKIDAAAKQLLAIINDILDISKIEADKIELAEEPFTILSTMHNIESIIKVQTNQKDISLVIDFDENMPDVVVGDEVRLSQILINLLSNAVKFTPIKGEIIFSARLLSREQDGIDVLEFAVKDNGIGIAPENQVHLFNSFEQAEQGISRKYGGTGLGLAISKKLAEMMDGGITLKSALGEGSCFTVKVCMKEGTRELIEASEMSAASDTDLTGRRALLVEDVDINREIAIALLSDTGIEIDVAVNGRIAVEMVRNGLKKYDVVLMDLQMPEMDGFAATKVIRAMNSDYAKNLPIIAMTANVFTEDIRRCLEVGMNDHVAKPIDFDELIVKISHQLTKNTPAAS